MNFRWKPMVDLSTFRIWFSWMKFFFVFLLIRSHAVPCRRDFTTRLGKIVISRASLISSHQSRNRHETMNLNVYYWAIGILNTRSVWCIWWDLIDCVGRSFNRDDLKSLLIFTFFVLFFFRCCCCFLPTYTRWMSVRRSRCVILLFIQPFLRPINAFLNCSITLGSASNDCIARIIIKAT